MYTYDLKTLHRGKNNKFYAKNYSGENIEVKELFPEEKWNNPEAYTKSHIHGYEPMLAKELDTEELQNEKMDDITYFLEEKFDGTRALLYFLSDSEKGFCRVFSRRISKKTNFYVENSDSVPQLRDINTPDLNGTIIDGEMFIDGLPFKEVSSTLNSLWDKAIDRQLQKGFISLHAFDILFYKGVDLRKMPLERRKVYLHLAIQEAQSPYIEEVVYQKCGGKVSAKEYLKTHGDTNQVFHRLLREGSEDSYPNFCGEMKHKHSNTDYEFSPRAFYEYIVATGGEGLILKPKRGRYYHKRGWEYSKVKKFLTRELIIIGFDKPTKEYTGKDKKNWNYWVDENDNRVAGNFYGDKHYTPVTKFYYMNQVGNLILGVLISKKEYNNIKEKKRGQVYKPSDLGLSDSLNEMNYVMEVCECAGFDDETREHFTENKDELIGTVVEVKANELFRDTGKMRHPRFLRQRFDKAPEQCTWLDHIGVEEVTR